MEHNRDYRMLLTSYLPDGSGIWWFPAVEGVLSGQLTQLACKRSCRGFRSGVHVSGGGSSSVCTSAPCW